MKIKNKFLKNIFIRFDFLIRFIYCKIPFVNTILPKLFFWKLYKSNYANIAKTFDTIHELSKKYGFSMKKKAVMEIGPGNSCLNAYLCLHKGAKKIFLIDKFPRNLRKKKQIDFCREEVKFFKEKYNISRQSYIDEETCRLNNKYITFLKGELPQLNVPEKVDFIFSLTTLQLIKDLGSYIARMSEIIKKGGFMYHQMDLKDKYNNTVDSPFLFYKYSDFVWEKFLTREGTSYANRLRYSEYIDLFKKYGFEIVWKETEEKPIGNIKINNKFEGRTDLNVSYLKILVRKK